VQWSRGAFVVSDDAGRIDRERVRRFIAGESCRARGIPQGTMDKAIDHEIHRPDAYRTA
jgi:hypothetical protein